MFFGSFENKVQWIFHSVKPLSDGSTEKKLGVYVVYYYRENKVSRARARDLYDTHVVCAKVGT